MAARAGLIAADAELKMTLIKLAAAATVLAFVLALAAPFVTAMLSSVVQVSRRVGAGGNGCIGAVVYGGLVVVLLGPALASAASWDRTIPRNAPLTSGADQA